MLDFGSLWHGPQVFLDIYLREDYGQFMLNLCTRRDDWKVNQYTLDTNCALVT